MSDLYACVYVSQFPAQALARLRFEIRVPPLIVMQGEPPMERVCSFNRAASAMGAEVGMTRVEAETLGVLILKRSVTEETIARSALLQSVSRFTPRVESVPMENACALVLDVTGMSQLFGSPLHIARQIQKDARALKLKVQIAVSRNFHTARCMALAGTKSIVLVPIEMEAELLGALPLQALAMHPDHAGVFNTWGLKTCAQLAVLPERELVARFGQEGKRLHMLARGEHPHLFKPMEDPFTLEEQIEFEEPLEILDSLLFALSPMLEQLILRAQQHSLALASVEVLLKLDQAEDHIRTVRPALPVADRQLLLKLLHLDLAAHPPSAAVRAMRLTAESGQVGKMQLGLFTPQLPEPGRLEVTLARIAAIVGEGRVGSAELKDTHAIENFAMKKFVVREEAFTKAKPQAAYSALRRLRPAAEITLTLQQQRPFSFFYEKIRYEVERCYGPWQRSGTWWSQEIWSTETWDIAARSSSGELLLCRLSNDLLRRLWYVEALYD